MGYNKNVLKYLASIVSCMGVLLVSMVPVHAQDTTRRRTIEITSSFKPSLQPQQKIGFTASPALGDTQRAALRYQIPTQNLAFRFYPTPLRPLAFQQDSSSISTSPSAFIKVGYGNFNTPFIKALASFGDGVKTNGSVEGNFISQKGKLPFQQYQQYGIKSNLWLHLKNNNSLHVNGGYEGLGTYRFGMEPKPTAISGDSLRVKYNSILLGAALGNALAGPGGIQYNASLQGHYFFDNNNGKEAALRFDIPVEKRLSDLAIFGLGLKGMVATYSNSDTSFGNHLILIPVYAKLRMQENILFTAGLTPSWNNNEFKLLPNIEFEYLLNNQNSVFQAGFKGYFDEQNYRSLALQNTWMAQPGRITNTRNSTFFVALKTNVNEQISYRLKAGVGKQFNVPLFVNDSKDGRSFDLIWEPDLNRVYASGEITYKRGEQFNWNTSVQINGFGGLSAAAKPFGLLPFELRSSLQLLINKDLRLKTDLYGFSGAWYQTKDGNNKRGTSAFDLNAGVEFDVRRNVKLWLQFNNIANMDYQRWNQYRVVGFQALGGAIFQW